MNLADSGRDFLRLAERVGKEGPGQGIAVSATPETRRDSLTPIASESLDYPQGDSKHFPQLLFQIAS
jgi:hypothetical protein